MDEQKFNILFKEVVGMLRAKLPENLYYHSPEHTIDVINSAERIAIGEHCTPDEVLLVKTAALFHDTGYLRDMREHEKHGCDIATEMLTSAGISKEEIDAICSLIMATKVPQQPQTKLEEIICDADLDYLGRDDYFSIADNLYKEFLAFRKIENEKEWMILQVTFLSAHHYFTRTGVQTRQKNAEQNLKKIRETVAG